MSVIINNLFTTKRTQCKCHVTGFNDAFGVEKHLIELILKEFKNDHYDFGDIYYDILETHEDLFENFDENSVKYIIRRAFETQISRRLLLCHPKTPKEKEKCRKMREEFKKCVTEIYNII
jgi:hypothetical protein